MKILVGWDNAEEADLIETYLAIDGVDGDTTVKTSAAELLEAAAQSNEWDVVLMTTSDSDGSLRLEVFEEIRTRLPDCPVVGACRNDDVYRVAQFLTGGMRNYIIRDLSGDYMFLLKVTLDNAVAAVKAERDQVLAAQLRSEVESVRKLQESILPSKIKGPDGYQISAQYEPSQIKVIGGRAVTLAGGDYYDVFAIDESHLVLLVGDASGHGMKACMSIMTMHSMVRMMRSREFTTTATFVGEINDWLCGQEIVHEGGGFITLLYGVLNTDSGEFVWTSAGHPFPILQDLTTNEVSLLGTEDDGGLPLAIMPNADYEVCTSHVPENSRLLICSDGLEEAIDGKNEEHRQFGVEGIMQTMKDTRDVSLKEALAQQFDDSNAFTQGTGRHDDTTVILLERS